MKIGFDISQGGSTKAGCGFLAYSLANELASSRATDDIVLLRTFGPDWWDPENFSISIDVPSVSPVKYACSFRSRHEMNEFWTRGPTRLAADLGHLDIIHSNNFFSPARMRRTKQVYTLHDMTVFECPQYTTEENRQICARGIVNAATVADFIVANSQFTLDNFLEYVSFDRERTAVIPLGSRFDGVSDPTHRPGSLDEVINRYILCVGTIEPRKNYDAALRAFAILLRRHDVHLVIAGKRGWGMGEFGALVDVLGLGDRVSLLSYVSDAELCWLYAHCELLLYPSFWEGFGLPVLEAMTYGCPVVTSRASALPEVVGEAGILIDPARVETIVWAVDRILTDNTLRQNLAEQARKRSATFSWRRAAEIIGNIYDELFWELRVKN